MACTRPPACLHVAGCRILTNQILWCPNAANGRPPTATCRPGLGCIAGLSNAGGQHEYLLLYAAAKAGRSSTELQRGHRVQPALRALAFFPRRLVCSFSAFCSCSPARIFALQQAFCALWLTSKELADRVAACHPSTPCRAIQARLAKGTPEPRAPKSHSLWGPTWPKRFTAPCATDPLVSLQHLAPCFSSLPPGLIIATVCGLYGLLFQKLLRLGAWLGLGRV